MHKVTKANTNFIYSSMQIKLTGVDKDTETFFCDFSPLVLFLVHTNILLKEIPPLKAFLSESSLCKHLMALLRSMKICQREREAKLSSHIKISILASFMLNISCLWCHVHLRSFLPLQEIIM